ncbi:MAG TPA: GTPase HflX [Magnetospirillaceae bacterium]|nr:GTPase HflX [Magnetospirillaceae bacterium]
METINAPPRAILVGVQLPAIDAPAHAASLEELGNLVKTLGIEVIGAVSQKREALDSRTVLGKGRIAELAAMADGEGSNLVIVDHEITPSQIRNIEQATGAQVLDRPGVIMEIFHRHARSREAKLQVEMARLTYQAPRLREHSSGNERRQGPGSGESDLDLERRAIRDRLAELRHELEDIQRESDRRRSGRRDQLRVALVGYTNAGKSSLMRALTGSEVLVADQLFATLDTTVRALRPETTPRILVADTVGFIRKLPHDLVASFRSTLAEALEAALLLYVVDASDPTRRSQLDVTREVLSEIGADSVAHIVVFNKIDRVNDEDRAILREEHPDAVLLSSLRPEDGIVLRERIIAFFETTMVEERILLPYAKQALLRDVYATMQVLSQDYVSEGLFLKVRALPAAIARLLTALAEA